MARDPARIPVILDLIRQVWEESPDMRLGQLVVNVTNEPNPFYVEDDVFTDALHEWIESSQTWTPR